MFHFDKAVNENENVSIYNTHEDVKRKKIYVIHEYITPAALKNRKRT